MSRCAIEGCVAPAADLCPHCRRTVCLSHSTLNEICFECVLGMYSVPGTNPDAPAIIWWRE